MAVKKAQADAKAIWAYCRVSTIKSEQELSLEEQVRWAQSFATLHGAALTIFKERASAKTVVGRPQCVRMLAALAAAQSTPQYLIATSFDRLSRDITDTLIIARALKDTGVKLYIRDRGEIAMNSFADQAALVGQAMAGHAENDARSARCRASWERRRREGKPTSNKSPYGLQLQGERDIPEPRSAPWILKAFQWYSRGQGTHSIALRLAKSAPPHRVLTSKLDAQGKRIVRERKIVWEYNRVLKFLRQRRYRGTIVPEALFDRVQDILDKRPRLRQKQVREYPLSGAVKCAGCGRSFHGHSTGGSSKLLSDGTRTTYNRTRYYACIVCNYHVNAERFENAFKLSIGKINASPRLIQRWISHEPETDVRSLAKEKLELEGLFEKHTFDKRRQRAWDLALADDAISADLGRQLREISSEEAHARDRLAEISTSLENVQFNKRSELEARRLLANFKPLFDRAPYDQKRALAAALVKALGGAVASVDGLLWVRQNRHFAFG